MDSGWVRKNTYATTSSSSGASPWGQVTPLPFFGSDEDLVEALRKGHPGAAKAFYDRYADVIDRVLSRVVGADDDGIPEMIQDAVLRAIAGIGRLRDPGRLPVWVATVAVTTARVHLRRRGRGPQPSRGQASEVGGRVAVHVQDAGAAFAAQGDEVAEDARVELAAPQVRHRDPLRLEQLRRRLRRLQPTERDAESLRVVAGEPPREQPRDAVDARARDAEFVADVKDRNRRQGLRPRSPRRRARCRGP